MNLEEKNNLLKFFLSQFGIGNIAKIYADENRINNYEDVVDEFKQIQKNIFDYIWEISEPDKQFNAHEIEEVSAIYCFEHYQWINKVGLNALNNWLLWMCWHEGILKK